jgi:hypothetical protein
VRIKANVADETATKEGTSMSAKSIYFVFAFVMLAVALMGSNGLLGNGEYRVIAVGGCVPLFVLFLILGAVKIIFGGRKKRKG